MAVKDARVIVLCAALLFLASNAVAENWARQLRGGGGSTGKAMNINLIGGVRTLDDGDWAPIDQQMEAAVDFDYTGEEWPWGLALCVSGYYSWADESLGAGDLESRTWEGQVGVRKIWSLGSNLHPYIGGGGSILNVELKYDDSSGSGSTDETGYGFWVGGGVYVTLFEFLNIGMDARWSRVDVDFGGSDADAGGWHIGGLIGYHWQEW